MTDALPDIPELDSTKVAGASFGRSRKGFEPTEVRTLLGRIADALRVWEQRDSKLVARVEELSRRLDEAEEFDEERVTEILGAETARIVAAARSAAAEMRSEAERESTELLERSRVESEQTAQRLIADARSDREAAESARSEAEEAATAIVAGATETAEKAVAEATTEAEELLTSARAEAETLSEEARARHDEMMAAASVLLDERTAAAQEVADRIRAEAEAEASEARAQATSELDSARKEAHRVLADAKAEATSELEVARERGREMLAETREVRQRMLRDLAEKNRLGRQKVEGAKAARAGVVDSIRVTLGVLETTLSELDGDDRELKRLADAAAAAVPDDVETVARELEADLDEADLDEDAIAADGPEVDAGESEDVVVDVMQVESETQAEVGDPEGADEPDAGSQDVPDEGAGSDGTFDISDTAEVDRGSAPDRDTETGEGTEGTGAEGEGTGSEETGSEQMASVHDLFEKIRSADANDTDIPEHPAGGATEEPPVVGGGVAVATAADTAVLARTEALPETELLSDTAVDAERGDASRTEADGDVVEGPDGEQGLLDRRDELLAPAERLIARNLKRLVGDEQNDVLDRARRHKRGRVELEALLGDGASEAFLAGLGDPYVLAAAAGAQMWAEMSGSQTVEPNSSDVADRLETQVAELLEMRRVKVREALEAHDRSGSDPGELVDMMRSVYRELRATTVPEMAADLAAGAFNSGTAVAAGSDSRWRWVPDNGGLPCADAEDNALEGPVACGQPFPTGDTLPPAHPGCRCILVPAGD